jgi:4-aminobutyrate aminotransferase-like enzyme/Ser/Thr protein kinase RdoA (MazF antagonist)
MAEVTDAPSFEPSQAVRLAANLYGLAAAAEPLPSERDQNFLLILSDGRKFVLKIANAAEARTALDLQNRAMDHLAGSEEPLPCPRLIRSLAGREIESVIDRSGGIIHFVRLVTYSEGVPLGTVNPRTPDLLADLGRTMGRIASRFQSFDHPASRRDFIWDLARGPETVRRFLPLISDPGRRADVERILASVEAVPRARFAGLRRSVIHNDANDYNVIVGPPGAGPDAFGRRRIAAVIDLGDMVWSFTAAEAAVACAYAMLGQEDPLAAAAAVVSGFHSALPLAEDELDVLYQLIRLRLLLSVAIAARQTGLKPENDYLSISQGPVWDLLPRLESIHPNFARFSLRKACGLEPCPEGGRVAAWLKSRRGGFAPVTNLDLSAAKRTVFDLGIGSALVEDLKIVDDTPAFTKILFGAIGRDGAEAGIGRYGEARLMTTSPIFRDAATPLAEGRTVHLGIDLFQTPGTPVHAPLHGTVHSVRDNAARGDYGPTVILRHETDDGPAFFTLYGHLGRRSIAGLFPGRTIARGQAFAEIGPAPENGDGPPHLHFQIIADLLGREGDFPGVCRANEKDVWLSLCPDPNLILGIPDADLAGPDLPPGEILGLRRKLLGPTLSIAYGSPLKIVRGAGAYLYDETGRAFLDAVNNVAHVGHGHPRVVQAAREQNAVLNTNTRYLHDNIVRYAARLKEKLPEPLGVFFFVNSGSEANDLALRLARNFTGARHMVVVDVGYHGNLSSLIEISPYKFNGPGGTGCPPHTQVAAIPDLYRGPFRAGDPGAGRKYAGSVREALDRIAAQGRRPAGFISESLLSCGGQIVLPDGYLAAAYAHVRDAGGVCIADEVQVGFGRTGTHFWGFETQGVVPDIVTMGKPIGNGHPLAAVVTTREIADAFVTGMEYFNTFGGNPVSCAVGLAVLDVMRDEGLQERALRVGARLKAGLEGLKSKHPLIGDVRGLGLFLGVELVLDAESRAPATAEATYTAERMRERGILTSTDGPYRNVLKIKPPLAFSESDADLFVRTLDLVLSEDPLRR